MKLEIYNGGATEPEKAVRLKLVDNGNGTIAIHVVDMDGKTEVAGRILSFQSDGTIARTASVGSNFGFALDEYRRVKTN